MWEFIDPNVGTIPHLGLKYHRKLPIWKFGYFSKSLTIGTFLTSFHI